MAGKKENLKSLFSNTRTRVIIVFTGVLLAIAVIVGYVKLKAASTGPSAAVNLSSAPGGIQSIPGAMEQTAQYAKLQEVQNVTQAQQAQKTGGSAIPTIIRTQAIGQGVGVIGSQSGVGFASLALENQEGAQRSLWVQNLQNSGCSKSEVTKILSQGAQISDLKAACSCAQLKDNGFSLQDLNQVCACKDLKAAGFNARQLKDTGYTAERLRDCGFNACELRNSGFTAQEMKDAGFSGDELKGAGFTDDEINRASGLPEGMSAADVLKAGCSVEALTKLHQQGVGASAIRRISGCSAEQLKAAGYTANELRGAGFTAADLKRAGFSPEQLKAAGYNARDLLNAGFSPADLTKAGYTAAQIKEAEAGLPPGFAAGHVSDCNVDTLKKARASGVSAATIRQTTGCSAAALKAAGYSATDLKNAGFTAAELKAAGFNANELKNAGFNPKELKDAGFSAQELKNAGFSAAQLKSAGFDAKSLKDAGFTAAQLKTAGFAAKDLKNAGFTAAELKASGFNAKDLKDAGFTAAELKASGFNAKDLKDAGYSAADLKAAGFRAKDLKDAGYGAKDLKDGGFSATDLKTAGFSAQELKDAGFDVASLEGFNEQQGTSSLSGVPGPGGATSAAVTNQPLQVLLARQNEQMAEQRHQQKIQQKTSDMTSIARQYLAEWKNVPTQNYTAGHAAEERVESAVAAGREVSVTETTVVSGPGANQGAFVKTGDILFAVMDTSVNSDEPGPILATIVSGRLKGSKLIGSFNLPSNANKMIITFNTLSVPGAPRTTSISAYAIDPNTARTALSSRTNHHYMLRYGSLFASSFLEGFGNAFQSANTTVTVGGTGGGNNVTISNGVGRSTLENAVIGLATVGKTWGQQAQQLFNTPTTVEVFAGTPLGILFTQDVRAL